MKNDEMEGTVLPADSDEQGGLLDIFANLHLTLSSLNTEMQAQRSREQRRLMDLPRSFMLPFTMPINAGGQGMVSIGGPQPGREWIVREITAVDSGYTGQQNGGISAVGAAGAATAVTLPGQSLITGFDVSFGPATATGTATITLSNVDGGPYTYYVDELVAGSEFLSKSLNLTSQSNATVSVSAVVNGGTVAINLYGVVGISGADLTWYIGQNINQGSNAPLPQTMAFARMHGIPDEIKYTSDVVRVLQNQQLIVGAASATVNSTINGIAKILDQPAFAERLRMASQ
jgi:hypothetical protein